MANEIPTHDKLGFPVVPCDRCCGDGVMEHFGHVDAGRCFKCHGSKVVRVGKAAKAYKAYAAALAEAQKGTVADLEVGMVFTLGPANTVTRWQKFVGIEDDKYNAGRIIVVGSKGRTGVEGTTFPVRIHRPGAVNVEEYTKGL